MACMSASSPTAAVTAGGQPIVSSGSQIASRGRRCWCEMPVFTRCSGTSRTATAVTSEPVPAVVGSATTGRSGPGTARPPPIGGLTQSRISPPWVASSAAAFTVSSADPPPNPTKPSKSPPRACSAAACMEATDGSPAGAA